MRSGSLLLAMMMIGGGAHAADCTAAGNARSQAECVHDQMSPDVIDRLYRLAMLTVHRGKLDTGHASDFIYIAEEAGEAARRTGPKPLLEMASSHEISKVFFAAHAITAFVGAVHHGYSHRNLFDEHGDAKLYADAKRVVRLPCKRFAAHDDIPIRAEGDRCLREIDQARPDLSSLFSGPPPDFSDVRAVPLSAGGGLRGSPEGAIDASGPTPREVRVSKAASKKRDPSSPAPPASN
jgi:hypothetical protein